MLVRKRREERGLSQTEFGQELKPPVTQGVISSWETGREPIPEGRYEDIARVLDIDVEEILGVAAYVRPDDLDRWRAVVFVHVRPLNVMACVMALAAFFDENTNLAMVTHEAISQRVASLSVDDVAKAWEGVLESPFVQRYGNSEWTFKLKFPAPDMRYGEAIK